MTTVNEVNGLTRPVRKMNLTPLDTVNGYEVRPGFYEINGATAIPYGVNFTVQSAGATACELLLFRPEEAEPYAVLPFPVHYRIGNVYAMIVFGLNIHEFEYAYRLDGPYDPRRGLLFNKKQYLLDPYARAVVGQSRWGERRQTMNHYRARVVEDDFDWGHMTHPLIPMSDLVIYEAHVRGFTQHESSGVANPGTFAGLREKKPYLKELGINAIELMPVFEFDEMLDARTYNRRRLIDYWGYNSVSFFAPNTAYSASQEKNREGNEFKQLVRDFNNDGIEVFLDVVFNHTAEGNECGHTYSFKGFDNNIYYMLMPDGKYYNFSGCGNTLNCNHPIVQQMILECLRYWVVNYHISGFRFDLASILGRSEDGLPMSKPPLLQSLAFDPILGNIKLIAEAWDAGGLYQVGSFPAWNRWAEWNGKYRDDLRSFLKGDGGFAAAAVQRIAGSPDLYDPAHRGANASVNFITCHDGFTLYDLYAYSEKHNEENGWDSTDGGDDNRSWNCGVEGATDDPVILALRHRLMRNACAVLLCSRGTPMFLAGDEFANTQFGNNNPYCQDNEISWLDWTFLEKNRDLHAFFRYMIAYRRRHTVIRKALGASGTGFPDISFHREISWNEDYHHESRLAGVLFAGRDMDGREDIVYIAVNAHWEGAQLQPPELPMGMTWQLDVNTGCANPWEAMPADWEHFAGGNGASRGVRILNFGENMWMEPRSVQVFSARQW